MKTRILRYITVAILPMAMFATNGDNLIAIGPIARGMGGLSVAYPQDPLSAVFANPAAMCFGPYCPMSELNASVTSFIPSPSAKVKNPITGETVSSDSKDAVYFIPAIGVSYPLPWGEQNRWRLGLSAYGVSGLGVDYRGTDLDSSLLGNKRSYLSLLPLPGFDFDAPVGVAQGIYTSLQKMKVAPSLAYQLLPNLSVGASLHINYAKLEIGSFGEVFEDDGTGLGYQVGALYAPTNNIFIGISYTSPQSITHEGVIDGRMLGLGMRDLELEAPQQVAAGISIELMEKRLVLGLEGKWINWSDASGYGDFEWVDQYVISLGCQYAVIPEKFYLRAGYNYANNPVQDNDDWYGLEFVSVQGTPFPRYFYETFRIVGFPAIVQHHATVGFTYVFNEKWSLNAAVMHAFEETITEEGQFLGRSTEIESSLSELSVELGLSWRF